MHCGAAPPGWQRPELDDRDWNSRPTLVERRDSGAPVLHQMATGRLPLSHAALDELPDSKVLAHLRAVLVSAGALPARDERMARLEQWLAATIAARPDPDERHLLHRYGTWHLVRRLRGRSGGAIPTSSTASCSPARPSTTP